MSPLAKLLAVVALPGLPGHAATNDIGSAVLRFPEIAAWKFRPDVAAECANTLILAGRDSTCDQRGHRVSIALASPGRNAPLAGSGDEMLPSANCPAEAVR